MRNKFSSFSPRVCVFLAKVSSLACPEILDWVKSRFPKTDLPLHGVETIAGSKACCTLSLIPGRDMQCLLVDVFPAITSTNLKLELVGHHDTGTLGSAQHAIR